MTDSATGRGPPHHKGPALGCSKYLGRLDHLAPVKRSTGGPVTTCLYLIRTMFDIFRPQVSSDWGTFHFGPTA